MSSPLVFGAFALHTQERRLLKEGQAILVGARAFDVLCVLVQHSGQLVSKDQLFDAVWPGRVVEENNLQVHVSTLRKILGADMIATIPGRGYRFTGKLQEPAVSVGNTLSSPQNTFSAQASLPSSVAMRSLAVLPFQNLDGLPQEEYFSDGIAEDVISHLTRSPWLFVVARNSSFTYRHSHVAPAQICRELQVHYLVTGQVRRVEDDQGHVRIRVNAQLIDGARNATLWSERFDHPMADLLQLQEQIGSRIVSAIEPVALRSEEQRALRSDALPSSPAQVKHWDLLMQARWHFWRSSREHLHTCEKLLLESLQLQANSSASLALLAFVHMSRVWAGWAAEPKSTLKEALRCAMQAVSQDDRDSHAHFTLGTALSCVGKMPQAIAEMEHALALYPQAAAAAGELARLLAFSGRCDEAHEFALQAMDASPHDPHLSLWVRSRAIASFVAQDYALASHFAMQAVAKRPDWFFNYYLLAACQALAGQAQAGRESLEAAQGLGPYSLAALRIGHPFTEEAHLQRFVQALQSLGWEA
jgi:TolB-like protein